MALYKSDLLHILCSSVMHTSVRSRVVVDTPRSCRCSFEAWWEVTLYIKHAQPFRSEEFCAAIGWGNEELQVYTAGNAAVAGGLLSISAERSGSGFKSARLTTAAKRAFAPGQGETLRIEGRIQLPPGQRHGLLC